MKNVSSLSPDLAATFRQKCIPRNQANLTNLSE